MEITLDFYSTLCAMVFVLLLGAFIIKKSKFLQDYNIPEPVVGGIIVAVAIFIANRYAGINFNFDGSLKDPLMLAFYASIGLSADFAAFKKGGKILFVFLFIVTGLLILQNLAGVGVALAMGENPLIGLLSGSITMSGGHGTGAAWAAEFIKEPYSYAPAMEIAMAAATFGLIAGGIIGGPVARYLVVKNNLIANNVANKDDSALFEKPEKERLITAGSFVESLALIAICLLVGTELKKIVTFVTMPTFVWCLLVGAVLRNLLSITKIHTVFDREVSVIGNVSLSLFLAFALMTINISQLISLALPMLAILIVQIVIMVFYAIFITYRFCGKNYDAAVLSAGHCGFGLGATPTALVNMQTVTKHYGPSHMAFIVVPLVGAFFIDIINAFVISGMVSLPIFH
ncbi:MULTISPECIES: sodium/glutamate symporter [Campylobacter]|uniref:sodium/glutamate symporter n=1 Tax=Campylobacter TaxID=194 RepID=UPI001B049BCB|nr:MULTISPECIES: sodium/glutamate symporter [Campylobacter]MBO5064375.1 sodium/glutamate symporter [Campylobacter sp.]MBQ7135221.1 sodium/glutamate symporter [Campylobacter sp.]MBQ8608923.1 sodium/glutamate symporter [Campylobacter sp.]MBQ8820562.1 sodium/glutamate symporter [Campylobacter sp.]MDL0104609.1 sodium/glutamate symporter [Campylobacter ovis]